MIVVSLVLVLVSGGLLAAGILSTSDPLVLASIALSLVAAVTLFLGIRQLRATRPLMDEVETVHPAPVVGAEASGRAAADQWRVAVGAQPAASHDTATESAAAAARIASPSQGLVRIRTTTGRPPATPTAPVSPTRTSPVLPAVGSARVGPAVGGTTTAKEPAQDAAAARAPAVEERRDPVRRRVDTPTTVVDTRLPPSVHPGRDTPGAAPDHAPPAAGVASPGGAMPGPDAASDGDAPPPGEARPDEGAASGGAGDPAAAVDGAATPDDDITAGVVPPTAPAAAVPATAPAAAVAADAGSADTVRAAVDAGSAEAVTGASPPGGTAPVDGLPADAAAAATSAEPATAEPPVGDVDPDGVEVEGYDEDLDDVPDPPDEPPPELLLASEEAKLSGREDEVLVVDGRPRFHLTGCDHLVDKDSQPLPVAEAMELGFTPCTLCAAATTLLGGVSP